MCRNLRWNIEQNKEALGCPVRRLVVGVSGAAVLLKFLAWQCRCLDKGTNGERTSLLSCRSTSGSDLHISTDIIRTSRSTLPSSAPRFTLIIASDLLWLADEHAALLSTLRACLARAGTAWFTCGHYTKRPLALGFFARAEERGFDWAEERVAGEWEGRMEVDVGRSRGEEGRRELGVRKSAVWAFRLWWSDASLPERDGEGAS